MLTEKKHPFHNMMINEDTMKLLNMYLMKEIPQTLPKIIGTMYMDSDYKNDCLEEQLSKSHHINKIKHLALSYQAIRAHVIEHIGWSLITWDWIDLLAEFFNGKKVLEVCAGVGTLSYALQQKGIDVICTGMDDNHHELNYQQTWTHVENMEATKAIQLYGPTVDYIIGSWFPYATFIASQCLSAMRQHKHLQMIFIGGMNEWVGDYHFHKNLIQIENHIIYKINNIYPHWHNIEDYLMLIK